uniref:LAGLIDADG endonuclease n=1 Tax=Cutaneotrichosporon cutaneum TaxID=5554 RepID=UPI00226CD947|nr:LAGLIDADG endonuclease [Cutaneotrichosporon cutaneum]UZC57735.1 LAGLIDADG endonuclease [Cutaneotrichosporon cutaneum]
MWNTSNGEKRVIKQSFFTKMNRTMRIGPHNSDIISLLVGRLLGDRYASKRSEKETRISFRQSIVHFYYLMYLYNFLRERGYSTSLPPRQYTRKLKGSVYLGLEFNTLTFISLDFLRRLFYDANGVKIVSPLLQSYLTPFALTIWFMDDPTYVKTSKSIRLARNSFTLLEVELLEKMLKENFDLDFTIQKVSDKKLTLKISIIYIY